jgi:hypothetical protein
MLIKLIKIAVAVGLVVGIGIQFIPVEGIGKNPPDRYKVEAPPEVLAILKQSCFDCHSNETAWPFYAKIAPGSWLMARDVRKGRSRMNFSEWGDTDEEERTIDKQNSWDQIQEGNMPPWFYIPMNPARALNDQEKAVLKEWLLKKKPEAAAQGHTPPAAPTEAAK